MGEGFFTNPFNFIPGNPASFIVLLNIIIGLKVGAGIGFLCIALVGREIV
jgi:multicomponent Na+:H+ antiporter subunit B